MSIYDLRLKSKRAICDDVVMLDFAREDGGRVKFAPGQYINIFLEGVAGAGGHAGRSYSMIPTDDGVRIAVRRKGEFSSALHELKIGDRVVADGPYGAMCPRKDQRKFVCLAGGIGVAPFVSWHKELCSRRDSGDGVEARFLVSNGHKRRSPFIGDLSSAQANKNKGDISVSLFFTREEVEGARGRRIGTEDLERAVSDMPDADFAVCGSISFTRDMWRALRKLGVPDERILTEAFY